MTWHLLRHPLSVVCDTPFTLVKISRIQLCRTVELRGYLQNHVHIFHRELAPHKSTFDSFFHAGQTFFWSCRSRYFRIREIFYSPYLYFIFIIRSLKPSLEQHLQRFPKELIVYASRAYGSFDKYKKFTLGNRLYIREKGKRPHISRGAWINVDQGEWPAVRGK